MERGIAQCAACTHVGAMHVGTIGPCRLNGCPCTFFAGPVATEPVLLDGITPPAPVFAAPLVIAASIALAFVSGIVVGWQL